MNNKLYKKLGMTTGKLKSLLIEKIKVGDLSHKEVITLLFIVEKFNSNKEVNVKILQDEFKVKVSSVVQILNKLELKNLIVRKNSKEDKRISIIVPTEKSLRIYNVFCTESEKFLLSVIEDYEEFYNCLAVLKKFNENLSEKKGIIINF
ncbi:winged helix-turn-helix transcriptional regulator [Gemella sp. GH3]|uniref:MarR family winged helix-turn-helix transcriptional regulator n=1 Tax=unclassified Gemella TaxID=2624949 RepID=UPI0015D0532A|nr:MULTISPECIES: MarR family winged helix-turn-helix transcriptional regulator [unclassified Gemella]MBF0713869.1 winged helix-turn-helix transcriptional regulator [Gemella sp. GH3.1]NYS50821.1 winged helix-turn-helix transcriptional regulator [Gemella sp. GH3]